MFCYQCGKELPAGTRFCIYCGAKQPETPVRTTTEAQPAYRQELIRSAPANQPAPTPSAPAYRPAPTPSVPANQPAPTPSAPAYQPAPAPSAPTYRSAAPAPAAGGALRAEDRCAFRLEVPEKLNSYRFGGDDNGYVDVYSDRLELFIKSKATALAFGAIGSAIEGKGKLYFTLRPSMVLNFQKQTNSKGALQHYLFTLSDGRMLRLQPVRGKTTEPFIDRLFGR